MTFEPNSLETKFLQQNGLRSTNKQSSQTEHYIVHTIGVILFLLMILMILFFFYQGKINENAPFAHYPPKWMPVSV